MNRIGAIILVLSVVLVGCADKDPPILTLNGEASVESILNENYTDPGATAEDEQDGNITPLISVSGNVDEDATGDYVLTYNVEDAAGNEAVPVSRTVTVRNEVDYLDGVYSVTANLAYGTGTGTPTTGNSGTDIIKASSSINMRFHLNAFPVYCELVGNDISIPMQNGNSNDMWYGSGTLNSDGSMNIILNHDNYWGSQPQYELTYTK